MHIKRSSLTNWFHRPFSAERPGSRRLLLIAALIVFFAAAASGPLGMVPAVQAQVPTPEPQVLTATTIPAPVSNQSQTDGMIIGGVLLVLIIVGGTLGVIRRKSLES